MDVWGWDADNGADLRQYSDTGATNQQWSIVDNGDGYYRIISRYSDKALDVAGFSTNDGGNIHLWDFLGTDNQLWRMEQRPSVGNNWKNAKIGGDGYVPGLVLHPVAPDVYYACTHIGGAYRWSTETSSWVAMTDGFGVTESNYIGSESIAIDPNDSNRVYMSTGLYISGGNGRLYISSDRGDNWPHVELPFPIGANNQGRAIGERMMVAPNLPSILFYGSRTAGLWKSTDGGSTWAQVTSLASIVMPNDVGTTSAGVQFVVFDTDTMGTGSATQTIYVGVGPEYASAAGLSKKVYKSTDGGATWVGIDTPVDGETNGEGEPIDYYIPHMVRAEDGRFYFALTATISSTSIAVNPNAEGDVWLVDGHSIFHSVDSGATWEELTVTESIWGENQWPDIYGASSIALGKPANGSEYSAAVYLVGVIDGVWGLYRSDDMGVSWERINDDDHQFGGIGQLAADNNIYGRVYVSGVGRGVLYNF